MFGVGSLMEYSSTLWLNLRSHYHYKQFKWLPLLGISILYTVEIHIIVPCHRWKRGDQKPISQMWFCDHTSYQNNIITVVNRMWRKFGLSLSYDAVINFLPYLKVHPNFEPFVFCTFSVLFTWDLKWYKTHTCDCIVLKIWRTTKNKPCLRSNDI